MAKLVGVFETAHTPFCYMPPDVWPAIRSARAHRADVPVDDAAASKQKYDRIQKAFGMLREQLAAARPDVIIIFGDDQKECFDFTNFPAFAVYVGEEFEGHTSSPAALVFDAFDSVGMKRPEGFEIAASNGGPAPKARLKGHPGLAVGILTGLMKRGFDPAFCMEMPKPEEGLGHAFLRPAETITDMKTPIIPILLNCYFAPQISGMRSYQLGRAVRAAIDEHPSDLRVAVIGSGGLWHTPGRKNAYLDEDFDRTCLEHMEAGDIKKMAEFFDAYTPPPDDGSQQLGPPGPASTGMPAFGGPQGGTREICNWIAAAAVADGRPGKVVDYVPVYASPIGCGFAYWPGL
jgi:hypothetical protein